jgi:hypothetical protein
VYKPATASLGAIWSFCSFMMVLMLPPPKTSKREIFSQLFSVLQAGFGIGFVNGNRHLLHTSQMAFRWYRKLFDLAPVVIIIGTGTEVGR